MKKFGFTLAEVLITLGIVGVIAAITIPSMSRNVSQKSIGPALAKAVNNLATVNTEALKQSGYTKLSDIATDGVTANKSALSRIDYTKILAKYMDGMREAGAVKNASLNQDAKDGVFYGNDGISYTVPVGLIKADISSQIMEDSGKYNGYYWRVTIGLKGMKSNKPGYDQFLVYVDDYGSVILAGGSTAQKYGAKYKSSKKDTKLDCVSSSQTSPARFKTVAKERCTASVAENGWQVKY